VKSIRTTAIVTALAAAAQAAPTVRTTYDETAGRAILTDGSESVLVYHYKTVPVPAPSTEAFGAEAKYAVPRSNYIHPLHGMDGAPLTSDWNKDHPHHRGIYWAWPEVVYKGETGDLHALQRVWARPTGRINTSTGDGWAEIRAEYQWMWEDEIAIVRETAGIRAWQAGPHGRWIDLTLRFEALEDGITIARRLTQHYGGLNMRLAKISGMKLSHFADPVDASPRIAWQTASGTWPESIQPSSVTVFEKASNPGYPGDYVQFPDISWFQPTFPPAGRRHALNKAQPLTLRYRIWIRTGQAPGEAELRKQWRIYQNSASR
jgi:hypothetical protein